MVENLKIEGIKDYPIKWICNFRGQKAIGICGYSQKNSYVCSRFQSFKDS